MPNIARLPRLRMSGAPFVVPGGVLLLLVGVLAGCGAPFRAERGEVAVRQAPQPGVAQPVAAPASTLPPWTAAEQALLRVVSKQAPLGGSYLPDELIALPPEAVSPGLGTLRLTPPTVAALLTMQAAARAAGLDVRVQSAYRSFEQQRQVHAALAVRVGEIEALRRSAPPGYSEHQLGTVVDFTSAALGWGLNVRFASTAEGQWLVAHAHEFGFALSYPDGAEAVTGYVYEPWHFRYIGVAHGAEWRRSGVTLVEYLGRVAVSAAR